MSITLSPPHDDLTFMSPLSAARAAALARFLADGGPGLVVDLGCGWAELLLQTVAIVPNARGIGIDTDEPSIQRGRDLALDRGLAPRVELRVADARTDGPAGADAAICIGASHIWAETSDGDQPIPYRTALAALRVLLRRGGRLVYGEGIWSRPPTEEAVAPLGGRLDEFVTLPELVEISVECGFMPLGIHEATLDEWDAFESGYSACYARWLAAHESDHPDAAEVRSMAARQRAAYLHGYRGVLGLGYLALVAV